MTNELQHNQLEKKAEKTIYDIIKSQEKELARALPSAMSPARLSRLVSTNIRTNPRLAKCTPLSLIGALHTAAAVGLEPIAGQAYLVPFANRKKIDGQWKTVLECQLIIGYQGLVSLFYRHCKSMSLSWGCVKENDEFAFQKGTEEYLHHKQALKDRGKTIAYWVMARLVSGGLCFEVMSYDECLEHAKKHSKAYSKEDYSSPWETDFDAMALKTVMKQLVKLLPLSVEMHAAIMADESSRTFNSDIASPEIIDLTPSETNWNDENQKKLPDPLENPEPEPPPYRDLLYAKLSEFPEDEVNEFFLKIKYIDRGKTYRTLSDTQVRFLVQDKDFMKRTQFKKK